MSALRTGLWAAERGFVPTPLMRVGIRRLLRQRIAAFSAGSSADAITKSIRESPVAIDVDRANDQHYELPPEFFRLVLGPRLKYSGCYWPRPDSTLAEAEEAALEQVCGRAQLADGQDVLELGCGWGSLAVYLAERYPNSRIVAVSNSATQKRFIDALRIPNLEVRTADMNTFAAGSQFDRIISIEMFEHMRNYDELFRRIASWLKSNGRLFVHVFCHRSQTYHFETDGAANWMGRYFFTGGTMPSRDLFASFDDAMSIDATWTINGTHYARTARAWRKQLERNGTAVRQLLTAVYGNAASQWYHRWRIFFLSCEELFDFREGTEWMVTHYLFRPPQSNAAAGVSP